MTFCCVIGGEDQIPRYTGDLVLCYRYGGGGGGEGTPGKKMPLCLV